MKKRCLFLIVLTAVGMLSCLLPWSGIYRGSIPPGNLPDIIFYGYQKNGLSCSLLFACVFLIAAVTFLRGEITKRLKTCAAFICSLVLAICLFDTLTIASQAHMKGAVPFLQIGPFVMGLVAVMILIILKHFRA
ncbi:hypothetical protein DDV21_004610 [Streptococcus chenjunshii]|uniref:DUF4293 family protein n=1 Tax=Streptococcus chenjunshii TaxID=2173853 RepID=A0A372KKE4_9STRE|nr:hypothetical protein DDV21_004610 [Streptococcus chenjunshii]RFU50522.1 hypothetical protein DDV22_08235 [Streptococcus chenjunshii]RFU52782.1 hypothetical protein DDV23_07875 [Streptococcus chenjunshii]